MNTGTGQVQQKHKPRAEASAESPPRAEGPVGSKGPVLPEHPTPPERGKTGSKRQTIPQKAQRGVSTEHKPSTLMVAAQSLAAASGSGHTLIDVLHGRVLNHYAEGIRQYLAVRLRDTDAAKDAFGQLKSAAAQTEPEELFREPGARARLFRLAREIADERLGEQGSSTTPSSQDSDGAVQCTLPWWRPPHAPASYVTALRQLRAAASEDHSELVELHYARELSVAEVAFVVGMPETDVEIALGNAMNKAERLLGESPPSRTADLQGALLEAFALEPQGSLEKQGSLERQGSSPLSGPEASEIQEGTRSVDPGTILGGRYEIAEQIGAGGFSDVYRATDTAVPGHVVALKLLHRRSESKEAKSASLRELRIIASVFHPSIVQFKDHGWHDGRLWFVMPWYEGETLEARIEREPLSRSEALDIFVPLARALGTLHAAGIRHQDIKPDNIFLAKLAGFGGHQSNDEILPVLLDLGVAAKEAELVVAGTPTYFAPEVAAQFAQMRVQTAVGPEADVFSLALTLRDALDPNTREDIPAGAVDRFIAERARRIPDAPLRKGLRFLRPHFARWMHIDPLLRPSADEFAESLPVLVRPEQRRQRVYRVLRWLLPLVVVVGAIFGSVVYQLDKRAQNEELRAREALDEAAALEAEVRAAEARIRSSKLSRAELASTLAQTQGELRVSEKGHRAQRRRGRVLESRLRDSRERLGNTRRDLQQERGRAEEAVSRADRLRTELLGTRDTLNDIETRLRARTEELQTLQTQSQAKQARLQEQLDALEAERDKAQQDLALVRRQLRESQNRPATNPSRTSPEPSSAETPAPSAPSGNGEPTSPTPNSSPDLRSAPVPVPRLQKHL